MSTAAFKQQPPPSSQQRHHGSHRSRHRSSSDPFSDPRANSHRPPDPPPKPNPYPSKMSTTTTAARAPAPLVDAVKDTVTVTTREAPRKVSRSQTGIPPHSAPSTGARSPEANRQRSRSQDSVTQAAAALERAKSKGGRNKKGSQHADVIDRLDFTGVGPMFHHDGPFDACAPSRNRHRNKAPMLAWSSTGGEPLPSAGTKDSPYPTPDVYKNFSNDYYYDAPKKKVDAVAEAWGIHEPEPYEDFSAGGGSGRPDGDTPTSSIYNGTSGARRGDPKKPKDGRDVREAYNQYLDNEAAPRRSTTKRSTLPPPQPIFVPEVDHRAFEASQVSPPLVSPKGDVPQRKKSLMQRFRKMRDSPNVPVADEPIPPSPTTAESYGAQSSGQQTPYEGKELPATPYGDGITPGIESEGVDYFDGGGGSGKHGGSSPGRKNSIMKKVRGVVRGGK